MPTSYEEWSAYHASSFGVPAGIEPRDLATWTATLMGYCEVWGEAGYSPDELTAATKQLINSAVPLRVPAEHRSAVYTVVMSKRAVAARQVLAAGEIDRGVCITCFNTGYVSVPHLQGVKNGRWEWSEGYRRRVSCAVLCKCERGRRMKFQNGHKDTVTLERYEDLNPQWEEQVDLDRRERREQQQGGAPDLRFSEALNRLIAKARQNGGLQEEEDIPF